MNRYPLAIGAMIHYLGQDRAAVQHALKVTSYAAAIAGGERLDESQMDLLLTAAALHDIGIPEAMRQYNSSAGPYQEELGPPIARELLSDMGYTQTELDTISFLIGNHHRYTLRGDVLLQMLFEADFLVNLEEGNLHNQPPKLIRDRNFQTPTGIAMITSLWGLT